MFVGSLLDILFPVFEINPPPIMLRIKQQSIDDIESEIEKSKR